MALYQEAEKTLANASDGFCGRWAVPTEAAETCSSKAR
jgi:hypothetical protein